MNQNNTLLLWTSLIGLLCFMEKIMLFFEDVLPEGRKGRKAKIPQWTEYLPAGQWGGLRAEFYLEECWELEPFEAIVKIGKFADCNTPEGGYKTLEFVKGEELFKTIDFDQKFKLIPVED